MNYNINQLNFIYEPLDNMKLLGIPGGGKTQSIIAKIIYHFEQKDLESIYNFFLLTFSRRATNDFIDKGVKNNCKFISKKNVKTIHSLSGKIVYALNNSKSNIKEIIILSALNIINDKEKHNELLNLEYLKNLKVIFVDEAQDLSFIQYELICAIQKITNCFVILIGDPNQNIYQFQNGSDKYLLNHPGKTFYLTTNYRSTPQIVSLINELRPWNNMLPVMESFYENRNEYRKPIVFVGSINEIIENIIDEIKKSVYKKEDIAIIGPVKKSKPINDDYTNIGLSLFTNILNYYDIKYIKHYEDNNFNSETEFKELRKKEDHINLFTIHGSKGLEFKQVFLLNFHVKTFGILPTVDKYNEFKYMWYVGISRCCYDLRIYVDYRKSCWHEMKKVNALLYNVEGMTLKFEKELRFNEKIKPLEYGVTEIINSKEYFDEYIYHEFNNLLEYTIEKKQLFEIDYIKENINTINHYSEYSKLIGTFMENIFNYYYHYKHRTVPDFINNLENKLMKTVIIPLHEKKIIQGYKVLKIKCPYIMKNMISLNDLNKIKKSFNKYEIELFDYLCILLDNNLDYNFYLDIENEVYKFMKDKLLLIIDEIKSNVNANNYHYYDTNIINCIFTITLYEYQKEYECAFIMNYDFTDLLDSLKQHITKIKEYIYNNNDIYNFHGLTIHPRINLIGEYDIMQDNKIIELKFTKEINIKHIIQIFLYYNNIFPSWKVKPELEIWNLYSGESYHINLSINEMNMYKILILLCKAMKIKMKNCIFVYDFINSGSYFTRNKVDILDRHFQEYELGFIPSSGLVKPETIQFIPFEITKKTGITIDITNNRDDSYDIMNNEIKNLIIYCEKPILLSYNRSDLILMDKKIVNYNDVIFININNFINLKNNKLEDVYQKLYKTYPIILNSKDSVNIVMQILNKSLNIEYIKSLSN